YVNYTITDTPLRKRLLLTTPRPSCKVGESSAAAAARQLRPTMTHRVDHSLVDTMETKFRDTERRMMTALEMVNMRVNYQVDVRSRESSEFYSRHHDAQKDHAAVRAEIEVLRRERLAYEQESMETRQALARSEAYYRALEARVIVLETEVCHHEWQRQATDDFAVRNIMRTQALDAGARIDTLEDTQNDTKEKDHKAMINEGVTAALAARDTTRNGDDSHTSGTGARRHHKQLYSSMPSQICYVYPARKCSYMVEFHVKTTTPEVPNAMLCVCALKKMMTDKYCPRGEIKKLEFEMWNLKVKGNDVVTYSQRFQELALMCDRMFPEESDKVEKYVGGLPDMIHGSVMATKPKTMQDAIEFATELMDKKISTFAERQAENKRKLDNNNQTQQQLPKRQNVAQAYAAGTGERKEYAGTLPLCNKCKFHHNGPCTVKCANCKRVGHLTRDCWSSAATNNQRTLTCYECGNQGHYRSDCPELKNRNHGNQAEGTEARGMVGPFKVLEQVESVAYKLKLLQELSRVYNMFHVSNLKKYYPDDPLVVLLEGLYVDEKLHFVEKPVEIMDREVKQLRRSHVPIVKVRWNSRQGAEYTWE
ncbi:reverse transcriptase domain-containing protein, partial [Tanacetum coccineum]